MKRKISAALLFSTLSFSSEMPIILKAVNYLKNKQVTEANPPLTFKGEWPSYMMSENDVLLLGYKGKKTYDSNMFTTASIHNSLAKAYLKNPEELKEIPEMLELAIDNILTYKHQDKNTFGFWPILPLDDLYKTRKEKKHNTYVEIRRPNHFILDSVFINNAANVPDDADDTAVAYLAMKLNQKVAENSGINSPQIPQDKIAPIFDEFRDTFKKRRSMHYYNVLHGANIYTGAYMTWLKDEKIFTPVSWAPTNHKERYIPYGSNEVDCVVNANVLNALATYNELDADGVEKACKFVKKNFKNTKKSSLCGLYYPNHFHLHYVAAKAISAGASCLDEIKNTIISDIIERQNENGSLESKPRKKSSLTKKAIQAINMGEKLRRRGKPNEQEIDTDWVEDLDPVDTLQSTIYAGLALSYLDPNNQGLEKIKNYILKNKNETQEEIYWNGGVFFAGGTLVRNDLKWRSNEYTTALVIELLSNMEQKNEK